MTPHPGRTCRRARFRAPLFALLVLSATPSLASAIGIRVHREGAAAPCTLVVFENGRWRGCDGIEDGSPEGDELAAVGEGAISRMKAWRTGRPGAALGSPAGPGALDSTDSLYGRPEDLERLRAEIGRTLLIDSIAVAIYSDSLSHATHVFHTRYWIARIVRLSGGEIAHLRQGAVSTRWAPTTREEIDRISYRETWSPPPEGRLLELEETESIDAHPVTDVTAEELGFPVQHFGPSAGATDGGLPSRADGTDGEAGGDSGPPSEFAFPSDCGCRAPGSWASAGSPRPQFSMPDRYSPPSEQPDLEGTVSLQACIDVQGHVCSVRVLFGIPGLTEEALEILEGWTFAPAHDSQGSPVATWIEIPFTFRRP